MFVIDTNILLYAVNPDSDDHGRARGLLDEWRSGDRSWFLTWSIVYEFLRVSTHGRVFPNPLGLVQAQEWIALLLASPMSGMLVPTERHSAVLKGLTHPWADWPVQTWARPRVQTILDGGATTQRAGGAFLLAPMYGHTIHPCRR